MGGALCGRGFDLSVGAVIAVTSVVSARFTSFSKAATPARQQGQQLLHNIVGAVRANLYYILAGIGIGPAK